MTAIEHVMKINLYAADDAGKVSNMHNQISCATVNCVIFLVIFNEYNTNAGIITFYDV